MLEVDPEHPGESAAAQVEPWGSIHASPEYLRHLVRVLVDRVVARARGAGRVISVDVTVNGRRYREEVEPRLLLSDFLRHRLGLTGTHVGCEHGVCGACTVRLDGVAVRSCLLLAAQVDGAEVVTVEGLAGAGALTPLQEAFHRHHALQCGFCTPGHPHRRRRPALARAPADTRGDRRHALRPALPLHRLHADRGRDRGGRRRVNLALSLLYAAERTPDAEALVGETTSA